MIIRIEKDQPTWQALTALEGWPWHPAQVGPCTGGAPKGGRHGAPDPEAAAAESEP